MNLNYEMIEVDLFDPINYEDIYDGWDGISTTKIIQSNPMGAQTFWLESIKNWNYKKNPQWLNEKAHLTFLWLKENYPELLI